MNPQDAEEFTQSLGQIVAGSWRQVALAKRLGVPKMLGLTTEQWVTERLGGYVKLSVPDRRDAVLELKSEGHSNRDIGDILGVDHKTVGNDLHNGENSPETDPGISKTDPDNFSIGENSPPPSFPGCTIKDLQTAVTEGRQFGCIYADPPWDTA